MGRSLRDRAYVFDVVRTPRGKGKPTGALHGVSPIELTAGLYRALLGSGAIAPDALDAVILGCATQVNAQGANIAKISALVGGLGPKVAGMTVGAFCTSGLEAIHAAAARVASGMDDVVIAGGVEMLSHVPVFADGGAWFADAAVREATRFVHMGVSADLVATLFGLTRADLDAYAVESHRRAAHAIAIGAFDRAIVPVKDAAGHVILDRDELVRSGLTFEDLARLAPSFAALGAEGHDALALAAHPELGAIEHLHTPGTSPGLADGAALAVLGHARAPGADKKPRACVRAFASRSVDPVDMLTGNPPATLEALRRAGLTVQDVDLFEVNESFAAVPITFARALDVDPERINVDGGAIALGHPLGATGVILLATVLDALERRDETIGVVSICGGAGIAAAMVVERLA